jgi:hypothetical protein
MNSYDNFLDAQWDDHCERQNIADRDAIMKDIKDIQICIDEEVDSWDYLRAEMNSEVACMLERVDAKEALEYGMILVAEWEQQIKTLRAEMRAIG